MALDSVSCASAAFGLIWQLVAISFCCRGPSSISTVLTGDLVAETKRVPGFKNNFLNLGDFAAQLVKAVHFNRHPGGLCRHDIAKAFVQE